MNPFIRFMASATGRIARIVAGAALIALGLLTVGGAAGIVLAIVGLVPLLAGVIDICIFAPLFSCPLNGAEIRAQS